MKHKGQKKTYVFGPVPSRRLGLSLGVDLIPGKTCSYDCLYCQLGKTTRKLTRPALFVPVQDVLRELEQRLKQVSPDFITLSGSGEPTLHSRIGEVIAGIKRFTGARIALLTNGSLLWNEHVRRSIRGADLILPTLCTAFERTFRSIHRPRGNLHLERIIQGMKQLRMEYKGAFFLEVMLLRGFNDSEEELEALKSLIREISPDRIQLNTVVRPPTDPGALPLDSSTLEDIKTFLGPTAEVIAPVKTGGRPARVRTPGDVVLEMVRRRPVRISDVVRSLNRPAPEVESVLNRLVREGSLRCGEHAGETYYFYRIEPEMK